jgi:hypothetical protein
MFTQDASGSSTRPEGAGSSRNPRRYPPGRRRGWGRRARWKRCPSDSLHGDDEDDNAELVLQTIGQGELRSGRIATASSPLGFGWEKMNRGREREIAGARAAGKAYMPTWNLPSQGLRHGIGIEVPMPPPHALQRKG